MKAHTASFTVRTQGKGTSEITDEVARIPPFDAVPLDIPSLFEAIEPLPQTP